MMTPLAERLRLLYERLSDEGRYVDSDIVAEAQNRILTLLEEINYLNEILESKR